MAQAPRRKSPYMVALYLYGLGIALLAIAEAVDAKWLNWPAGLAMLVGLLYALWAACCRIALGTWRDVRHVAQFGLTQEAQAPAWIRWPFATKLLIAVYVLALMPAGLAIRHATRGEWLESAGFAALWLLVFPIVALHLHRRRLLHIGVSVFAAAAAAAAFPLALLFVD